MHGRAEDAIELFLKMEKDKAKPDGITFAGVLNACAHCRNQDLPKKDFTSLMLWKMFMG